MCIVLVLKFALLVVKNGCFGVKKGINEFWCKVAAKHTTYIFVLFVWYYHRIN